LDSRLRALLSGIIFTVENRPTIGKTVVPGIAGNDFPRKREPMLTARSRLFVADEVEMKNVVSILSMDSRLHGNDDAISDGF